MGKLQDLVTIHSYHNDPERRKITDVSRQIKVFEIADKQGIQLGNHYHQYMRELFHVISGQVHIKLEDVQTKERQEYRLEPGQSMEMPLYVAHLVLPESCSIFLKRISPGFDPNDLNKYDITW